MQKVEIITAKAIHPGADDLVIELEDQQVSIAWERCSQRLASATAEQRRHAELSPGGYGIHWPLIDEDLSIVGLVRQVEHREQDSE